MPITASAHWRLNESSGSRRDATGHGNTLSESSSLGSTTGKLAKAANFDGSAWLSRDDTADLSAGSGVPFTVACWVYIDDLQGGADVGILGKWTGADVAEYALVTYLGQFYWAVKDADGTQVNLAFETPTTGGWYFLVCWYDPADGKTHAQVNNGTVYDSSSTLVGGIRNGTNDFYVGRYFAAGTVHKGRIDSVTIAKEVWDADQRTEMYNGGAALDYPFSAPGFWNAGDATGVVWAYQPIGSSSLAASYADVTGCGNDAGVGVAPTFNSATGWTFNGIDQYLTTAVAPAADGSWSFLIRLIDWNRSGISVPFGAGGAVMNFHVAMVDGLMQIANRKYASAFSTPPASVVLGAAGDHAYQDGVDIGTLVVDGMGTPGLPYIGAANLGSGGSFPALVKVAAVVMWDNTLTADQMAAVSACMAGLPLPCGGSTLFRRSLSDLGTRVGTRQVAA